MITAASAGATRRPLPRPIMEAGWPCAIFSSARTLRPSSITPLFLSATALPAAYALKTFFQFAFGRISAREWLILKTPHRFNWFNDFGNGCFPSGHMTVFAAFGTAILIYYPQYRKAVIILLTLLGAALITTDYHYLSDVIAGAYLGVLTTYILWQALQKRIAVS